MQISSADPNLKMQLLLYTSYGKNWKSPLQIIDVKKLQPKITKET